jgi:hypothetical protein
LILLLGGTYMVAEVLVTRSIRRVQRPRDNVSQG